MQNTYGDISPKIEGYAAAKLLERGQPYLVLERFGIRDPQPKRSTKTRKWRRYEALPVSTAPLAEGITPAGMTLQYTDYTAVLEQLGGWVPLTDVILDTHDDAVLDETIDLLQENAVEVVETYRFNGLKGGTNVYYANAAASRSAVNSPATRGDFRRIERGFLRNRARKITKIIKATAMVATQPVDAAFVAVCHPDCMSDIRGLTGFVPTEEYSNSTKKLAENEFGKLESFRFMFSDIFDSWQAAGTSGTTYLSGGAAVSSSTACDVYPILVFARNAYGIVPLQGEDAIEIYVSNPKPGPADQLAQKAHAGFKTYQAIAILQQLYMARLEVAATANPS